MNISLVTSKNVAGITVPVDLDVNGFQSGLHFDIDLYFDADRINQARKVIRQHLLPVAGVQKHSSSYGIKHIVEKALGHHLSNGELIVAMIGEGYVFDRKSINCYFNVSLSRLTKLNKQYEQPAQNGTVATYEHNH